MKVAARELGTAQPLAKLEWRLEPGRSPRSAMVGVGLLASAAHTFAKRDDRRWHR